MKVTRMIPVEVKTRMAGTHPRLILPITPIRRPTTRTLDQAFLNEHTNYNLKLHERANFGSITYP
jgi:hypothetical protein